MFPPGNRLHGPRSRDLCLSIAEESARYGRGVQELGALLRSPYNKDYSLLGSILGPAFCGDYHIDSWPCTLFFSLSLSLSVFKTVIAATAPAMDAEAVPQTADSDSLCC